MSDNTVVTENTVTNIVEVTSAGPAGPPGATLTIQDQGVSEGLLTDKLNFAGSTVSVNNDTVNEIATVTINAANPGANSNITSLSGITGGISSADYLQFDTAAGATGAVGRMLWNDTDGTLEFQMKGGNVTLQVGQEEVVRVTNQYGSTISDGQAVYITGSTGNHLNVTLAQANSEVNSSKTLAVVTESIANNGTGFATTSGLVRNLNTSALTEGAAIWLSPTVPGGLTSTKPVAPNHAVLIGWCVKQHATVGVIYVHIANGYELEELHNVLITSVTNNQVLRYDSATGLWKNATISPTVTLAGAVTGSGTLTDLGNVTITTTATSDPTLTLSGDASGSATFTNLGDATLTVTVADNSHDHTIANVTGLQTALDLKAPLASPTFTGSVTLPATTAIGTVSATEIGYLDGVTSAIQTQIDTKLASASYTAADVLTKIKTVDGSGSGLDADLLDGQDSAYYTAINARLGYTAENAANKGVAGGYASLDGSGTVPTSQLPAAVLGAVKYQGTWNASTNSPALTSSVGTQGYYYVVSVAGSTNLNGITDWVVGDWAIYNGSTWQKIDNTDAVTSVAGRTGAVTLSASDVSGLATVATSGAISDTTGTLAVGRGGTGATTLTSGYLVKGNGTSAVSASVVYDNGTNVGIGTTSPLYELDTFKAKTGVVNIAVGNNVGAPNDGARFNLHYSGTSIGSYGYTWDGGAFYNTLDHFHYLRFAKQGVEQMRLDASGNLGIGTSSPGAKLNIVGDNTPFRGQLSLQTSTLGNFAQMTFYDRTTLGAQLYQQYTAVAGVGDFVIANTGAAAITLNTAGTERMRITAAGDVGIGTSSPSYKLDAFGSVRLKTGVTGTPVIVSTGGDSQGTLRFGSTGTEYSINGGADYLAMIFNANATERMRIDSSGNVGIGTSSPNAPLTFASSTGRKVGFYQGTEGYSIGVESSQFRFVTDSSAIFSWRNGSTYSSSTEYMRLDASGNLGLGATPSAWGSAWNVFQVAGSALSNNYGTSASLNLTNNLYYDSANTPRYIGSGGFATRYVQSYFNGTHEWFIAPSGTAGAAISFTQAMTLDATGNLGINCTAVGISGYRGIELAGTSTTQGGFFRMRTSDSSVTSLDFLDINGRGMFTTTAHPLRFGTSDTERARIDSSGNLLVGTTSGLSGAKTEIRQNADANYSTTFTTGTTKNLLTLRDLSDVGTYSTPFSTLAFAAGSSGSAWATITGVRTASQSSAIAFGTANGSSNTEERMRIDSSGNLLVGTTALNVGNVNGMVLATGSIAGQIAIGHISGTASGQEYANFLYNSGQIGNIAQDGTTAVKYNTTSDRRLKNNIIPAPEAGSVIDAIEIVSHGWKSAPNEQVKYGVIAQDLMLVAPQAVTAGDDGEEIERAWGVDYSKLVPMLVKEVQSLRARVAQLEGN